MATRKTKNKKYSEPIKKVRDKKLLSKPSMIDLNRRLVLNGPKDATVLLGFLARCVVSELISENKIRLLCHVCNTFTFAYRNAILEEKINKLEHQLTLQGMD